MRLLDQDEAMGRYLTAGLSVRFIGAYRGSRFPLLVACLVCGSILKSIPSNAWSVRSIGCWCAKTPHPNEDMVLRRYSQMGYQVKPVGPFVKSSEPYRVWCLRCDIEVRCRPSDVWSKDIFGCSCSRVRMSKVARSGLYLIERLGHLKVGLGRYSRIRTHIQHGWTVLVHESEMPSGISIPTERDILSAWRCAGYPPSLDRPSVPQGGYTETVLDTPITRALAEDLILQALVDEEAAEIVPR